MLSSARMRTRLSLSAVLAITLSLPLAAHAGGGYVSAGVGGGAGLDGQLENTFTTDEARSGRFSLGQRIGPVALEVSLLGAEMFGQNAYVGMREQYTALTAGVDLKYYVGLTGPLELYGKAGLNKTWLMEPAGSSHDYDGRGWDLGAGLQFTIDTPAAMAAIWLDFTHLRTDLRDGESRALDGQMNMLTLGLSLGF